MQVLLIYDFTKLMKTMDNLFILSFIVICVIVAIMLFLAIKRRRKTKQTNVSDDIIAKKNPLYVENFEKDEHHYEQ